MKHPGFFRRAAGVLGAISLMQAAVTESIQAAASTKPAVVLVHGIFDTARAMRDVERHFRQLGYETVSISFTPGDGRASIEALARQLDEFIRASLPEDRAFHLIGHSMGGLIMRCYAQQFAPPDRIVGFVTLGSPHHGSLLAWLLPFTGCKDMRPGSTLLQRLQEKDHLLACLEPLSIWTPLDLMILPSHSSHWPVARNEPVWLPLHPSLKHSRKVNERVAAHLLAREAALASPSSQETS